MNSVETIEFEKLNLYFIDISNADTNNACRLLEEIETVAVPSHKLIGVIVKAESLFVTPKMRQTGKKLTIALENTNRYIGATMYGVNSFVQLVAKLANPKAQFGKTKEECIQLIQEMLEGKRPNHLPHKQ